MSNMTVEENKLFKIYLSELFVYFSPVLGYIKRQCAVLWFKERWMNEDERKKMLGVFSWEDFLYN